MRCRCGGRRCLYSPPVVRCKLERKALATFGVEFWVSSTCMSGLTSQQENKYLKLPQDSIIDAFTGTGEYSFKPYGKHRFYIGREVLRMIGT